MKLLRKFLPVLVVLLVIGGIVFWFRPIEVGRAFQHLSMALGGFQSHTVTISGFRVHYIAIGPEDGHPLVLVHGLGGRCEDWVNLAPFLARAGYRVYMPDLPGYGTSQQPADFSYSVPDEAAIVLGFFDALGLKQADLGGWSMGGWIVQLIAAHHPDRIRRLMLFDSAGIYRRPAWNTALFTPRSAAELDQLDVLLMPHPPVVPGFIARDILRISHRNAWVIHRALDSMLAGNDATDKLLPELKMPVLIVWGDVDHIMPVDQAQTIHSLIPQSKLDVIPGCGHLAPGQCADRIAPGVIEFLKQPNG